MNCIDLIEALPGNGMMVFSDAAGAKSCLGLASILLKKNPALQIRLFSNQNHTFYTEWPVSVELVNRAEEINLEGFNWLFTGTSHPDSSSGFELNVIQKALKNGIQTISFIDHQTALAERFQLNSKNIFPDLILLTNNVDLTDAVAAGLPENRLKNCEDPYKTYLRDYWSSQTTFAEFRSAYHIPDAVEHIITIAPDPISLRHDLKTFGFNELTFLANFLPLIQENSSLFFILKIHPLQPSAPINKLLSNIGASNVVLDERGKFPNAEIIYHSSAVIGFFSNFLVEANMLGKPIFRYLSPGEDNFERIFRNFGIHCTSEEQLVHELKAYLDTCKTV